MKQVPEQIQAFAAILGYKFCYQCPDCARWYFTQIKMQYKGMPCYECAMLAPQLNEYILK